MYVMSSINQCMSCYQWSNACHQWTNACHVINQPTHVLSQPTHACHDINQPMHVMSSINQCMSSVNQCMSCSQSTNACHIVGQAMTVIIIVSQWNAVQEAPWVNLWETDSGTTQNSCSNCLEWKLSTYQLLKIYTLTVTLHRLSGAIYTLVFFSLSIFNRSLQVVMKSAYLYRENSISTSGLWLSQKRRTHRVAPLQHQNFELHQQQMTYTCTRLDHHQHQITCTGTRLYHQHQITYTGMRLYHQHQITYTGTRLYHHRHQITYTGIRLDHHQHQEQHTYHKNTHLSRTTARRTHPMRTITRKHTSPGSF